jgi:predicted hydrocarbon binding protein
MATATPTRQLNFPSSLLVTLLSAVAADREPAQTVDLLRQAGYDAGADLYALLGERVARQGDDAIEALPAAEFWRHFASLWESLGWGSLQHRQTHPGVAELVSPDWVEAETSASGFGCQLTTGLFADLLRRAAGDDIAVLEVECRGRGDAQCRFLVGSAATLGALHDSVRQGRSAEDWLARSA